MDAIMKTLLIIVLIQLSFMKSGLNAQNAVHEDPLNGLKKEYYQNGKISREYTLENGIVNGIYKTYSEKGLLISEQSYSDGLPSGLMKTFYENGQVKSESYFKDGLITGQSKEFYESGNLKSESNLTGNPGEYSGTTVLYFENGGVFKEGIYSHGKFVKSVQYDDKGRVTFVDTEGHSTNYVYYPDGTVHVCVDGVDTSKK